MFRVSKVRQWFRARSEFERVRSGLSGKARVCKHWGARIMLFRLRAETDYRVSGGQAKHLSSKRAARINAAAQEQGTHIGMLQDLAMQNCMLENNAIETLALYEPLAFRSLCELAASKIQPPPPKHPEVFDALPLEDPHTALRTGVKKILHDGLQRKGSPIHQALQQKTTTKDHEQCSGDEIVEEWVNSWREFEDVTESERVVERQIDET